VAAIGWTTRREQKVDVVVSLLVPDEVQEFNLEPEQRYCEQTGIFRSLHIVDREVPRPIEDARQLVRKVALDLGAGKSVVVHCRQVIGRFRTNRDRSADASRTETGRRPRFCVACARSRGS